MWLVTLLLSALCLVLRAQSEDCALTGQAHLQCELDKECDESLSRSAYIRTGERPGAPVSFDIEPYSVPCENPPEATKYCSAARFKWDAKVSNLEYLNGFELTLTDVSNPANRLCRVFNLTDSQWRLGDNPINLLYELSDINGSSTYFVKLSSLPELNDPGRSPNYVTAFFRASILQDNNRLNSESFQSTISVSVDDEYHTVTVRFLLAPENYGFEKYTVYLINGSTSRKHAHSKEVTPTPKSKYHSITFENICSGQYRIEVEPVNPDRYNDNNNCVCLKEGECKEYCFRTSTGAINVTGDPHGPCQYVPPTTGVDTTFPITDSTLRSSSAPRNDETTSSTPDNSGYIAAIVVPVCAAAAILLNVAVIRVLYYIDRRKKRESELIAIVKSQQNRSPDLHVMTENFGSDQDTKVLTSRRRLFILYFPDHEFHDQVVTDFANFLHKICGCDVRLDKWCQNEIHKLTKTEWLNHEISTAERIIIINSEGAYRKWQAAKAGKIYKQMETATPCGDMFITGIRIISNLLDYPVIDHSRFISTRFSYTHENFAVPTLSSISSKYYMMDHIEGLFFHVHGVNKDEPGARQKAVGINKNEYRIRTTAGKELYKSILETHSFVGAHPNWFREQYGEPVNGSVMPYNRYDSGVESMPSGTPSGGYTPLSIDDSADVKNMHHQLTIPAEFRGNVFIPTEFEANSSEPMRVFNAGYAEEDMDKLTVFTADDCVTLYQDSEIKMEPCNDDAQDGVSHSSIEV